MQKILASCFRLTEPWPLQPLGEVRELFLSLFVVLPFRYTNESLKKDLHPILKSLGLRFRFTPNFFFLFFHILKGNKYLGP